MSRARRPRKRRTPEELAWIKHAHHRGLVLTATGDRVRPIGWHPHRSKVLVGTRHQMVDTAAIWPLCVCGQPVSAERLHVGDRLCDWCHDTQMTRKHEAELTSQEQPA